MVRQCALQAPSAMPQNHQRVSQVRHAMPQDHQRVSFAPTGMQQPACGWLNQPRRNVTLPTALQQLTFGFRPNQPLDNVSLPSLLLQQIGQTHILESVAPIARELDVITYFDGFPA